MFWSLGVISNLYKSSPVKIPCSAYSVSMSLAISVNFWDAGPEAIGEDMHMYLKCFFSTGGKVIVKSIFSPASQCNIEGTGTGVAGYLSGLRARYVQSKRHLWGTLDFGYCIRRTILSYISPDSQLTVHLKNTVTKLDHEEPLAFKIANISTMIYRMIEVHIFMGQFLTMIIFSNIFIPQPGSYFPSVTTYLYNTFISSQPVSELLLAGLNIGYLLRLSCIPCSILTFYLYELYHDYVGFKRWDLQPNTEISSSSTFIDIDSEPLVQPLGLRPQLGSRRKILNAVDWLVAPFSGIIYFLIPMLHAQFSHLITDRLEYQVAGKPSVGVRKSSIPSRVLLRRGSGMENSVKVNIYEPIEESHHSRKGEYNYQELFNSEKRFQNRVILNSLTFEENIEISRVSSLSPTNLSVKSCGERGSMVSDEGFFEESLSDG